MRLLMPLAVVAMLLAGNAAAQSLHLVCLGLGTANRVTTTNGYASDSQGNSAWGQTVSQRAVPFDDQVNLDLNADDTGRIRMPRAMLPPIHGGDDGWFRIKDVRRTSTEITGTVQVNFMNKPKIVLDRITGRISISGRAGEYSGECQSYNPEEVQRKF